MTLRNKKKKIIDSAVMLLKSNGHNTTISEIASAACVNDSVIYHYFKNKEDLLFHAVGEVMKAHTKSVLKTLQGIMDPVSRLSKFIWEYLSYHEENSTYTKYVIFHCRSKKSFFRHESFGHFLNWAQILRKIIEDGIEEKVFSASLPVEVAEDMILGFLDMEEIDFFAGHRSTMATKDFEQILKMILCLLCDVNKLPPVWSKRETILIAAEKLFAQKDYHKATTIEIAKAGHVSEPTLYEYFTNKEDILMSIVQYRLRQTLSVMDMFFGVQTPIVKMTGFIYYYFTMCLREPDFARIFVLNSIYNSQFYLSPAHDDYLQYMGILDGILEEGKTTGFFRPEVDTCRFKYFFQGVFNHSALKWLLTDDNKRFEMLKRINDVTHLLIKLLIVPGPSLIPKSWTENYYKTGNDGSSVD